MRRLERDHGNLRAVVEWCAEDPSRAELQMRLQSALMWFHFTQGLFREPRDTLAGTFAQGLDGVPRAVVGRAYNALGCFSMWQGACTDYYRAPSGRIVTQWPRSMPALEQALASLDEDAYEAAPLPTN